MIAYFFVGAMLLTLLVSNFVKKISQFKKLKYNNINESFYNEKKYNLFFFVIIFLVTYISFTNYYFLHASLIVFFTFIACIVTAVDNSLRIIPNEIILILIPSGMLFRYLEGGYLSVLHGLFAMIAVFIVFMLTMVVSKGFSGGSKIGAGDLKLLMVVALISGYPNVLYSISSMAISMLIFIIFSLLTKRMTIHSTFPMAGFIMFGLIFGLLNKVVWIL